MVVGDKKFGVMSHVCNSIKEVWGYFPPENIFIFPPLGLHFVRFLKQIFGYTALHYTVNKLNL